MTFARTFLLGLVAACMVSPLGAAAQDYPSKPIRMIVPFSAGGGADTVARLVAKEAGRLLGQQIVVDNRAGAAAIIGTELVARAQPDGYTLLFGQSGPISINPALYKTLSYNPIKDFAPITMTTAYPYVLVVNASLASKTLGEFIALSKSRAGDMTYGTAGIGAANHLVSELFNGKAGLKMVHVPYKGTNPAVTAVVGNEVTMVFSDPFSARPHTNAGTLRALAVTSAKESAAAPGVPTVAESGMPGFEALAWHGILAPAGTPPDIIKRLNEAFVKVLRTPEMEKTLISFGADAIGNTPEEFAAFIREDVDKWRGVVENAGIEQK